MDQGFPPRQRVSRPNPHALTAMPRPADAHSSTTATWSAAANESRRRRSHSAPTKLSLLSGQAENGRCRAVRCGWLGRGHGPRASGRGPKHAAAAMLGDTRKAAACANGRKVSATRIEMRKVFSQALREELLHPGPAIAGIRQDTNAERRPAGERARRGGSPKLTRARRRDRAASWRGWSDAIAKGRGGRRRAAVTDRWPGKRETAARVREPGLRSQCGGRGNQVHPADSSAMAAERSGRGWRFTGSISRGSQRSAELVRVLRARWSRGGSCHAEPNARGFAARSKGADIQENHGMGGRFPPVLWGGG